MPHHVQNGYARTFLTKGLELFKESLENWLGRKIEDRADEEAVEVHNRNREQPKRPFSVGRRIGCIPSARAS
jgi:benzoyl-CoA reductase/2-hydroxyglutaryl-CoA dehydratase subunit BcrC/BadD/HgdB